MIPIAFILLYFIIGWGWATLVIYKNWLCCADYNHSFGFMFLFWPIDILRRIVFRIADWIEEYHIWIVKKRVEKEEKNCK